MSATHHARTMLAFLAPRIGPVGLIRHGHMPWHSATFAGMRHCLTCSVPSTADVAAFARALPDAEIPLSRGFVADARIASIEPVIDGQQVTVEFLTIDAD